MPNKIQITNDGSHTFYSDTFGETYHSINGAITESVHVFINAGFRYVNKTKLMILEIGFGSGLNAFLTYQEAKKSTQLVSYTTLELFPINEDEYVKINYPELEQFNSEKEIFQILHKAPWNSETRISNFFTIKKFQSDFVLFDFPVEQFDVIYFDAFSPASQPNLWTIEMFKKMYMTLDKGGILTTYCAKGEVRRNMQHAGFFVERLQGPPGKREMLRGRKN